MSRLSITTPSRGWLVKLSNIQNFSALTLALALSACSTAELQQFNQTLGRINGTVATPPSGGQATSQPIATSGAAPVTSAVVTALTVPTDPNTKAAMDAALPIIKKILSIHSCVRVESGMLQLNFYAVPGVNIGRDYQYEYPNSPYRVQYHDRSKCMSVKTIDGWAMPALNALQFRAVYFADDSGETNNYTYLMKRGDDGAWRLQQLQRSN